MKVPASANPHNSSVYVIWNGTVEAVWAVTARGLPQCPPRTSNARPRLALTWRPRPGQIRATYAQYLIRKHHEFNVPGEKLLHDDIFALM